MKSTIAVAGEGRNKAKPDTRIASRSEKKVHATTTNPNRLKIIKSATVGHVRGGHAFH